jgi:hypothetical protein
MLDRLRTLMPPPARAPETGGGRAWAAVWRSLGTRLPDDFVAFIETYGPGEVCGWLTIRSPFSDGAAGFVAAMLATLGALREFKANHPKEVPYPLHFEPGGLIPWGTSIDGDEFCWLARGLPSEWTTVIVCRHAPIEEHPFGLEALLEHAVQSRLQSMAWPDDISEVVFVPAGR